MQIAMVAAGFSGSEADVLRRSMAAWARRGGMEHMHRRLVDGMLERGYSEAFAEQIFQQIRGFGEYGFPESHAASFALLVYISAWLKCHHPAAFCCALLNAQPMGFYQPAQLVQDAQRHGVKVLPADVRYSDWDCTLEDDIWGQSKKSAQRNRSNEMARSNFYSDPKCPGFSRDGCGSQNPSRLKPLLQGPHGKAGPALRLGLRMIKGMREDSARRIEQARRAGAFTDVQALTYRAALDRHDLAVLAEAAALRGLAGHRHRARWEVAAVEKPRDDLLRGDRVTDSCRSGFSRDGCGSQNPSRLKSLLQLSNSDPNPADREQSSLLQQTGESRISIRPPSQIDDTHADYASTGLTLGKHPVALLRSVLKRRRVLTSRELHQRPHGSRVRACGLITMRQRPMTASGTVFLTLEDETGCINAVIWPRLFEKQRAEILGSNLLAVDGVLETDGDVHHLIADRVHDFSHLADGLHSKSRDFC